MRFIGQIDPFDGGPYYGAAIADLAPTKELQSLTAIAGQSTPEHARSRLIAYSGPEGFRAIRADAEINQSGIMLTAGQLAALGAEVGAQVDTVPLPERDASSVTLRPSQPSPSLK